MVQRTKSSGCGPVGSQPYKFCLCFYWVAYQSIGETLGELGGDLKEVSLGLRTTYRSSVKWICRCTSPYTWDDKEKDQCQCSGAEFWRNIPWLKQRVKLIEDHLVSFLWPHENSLPRNHYPVHKLVWNVEALENKFVHWLAGWGDGFFYLKLQNNV